MASVTSAFSDLPQPPYSHPEEYEALVDAMLQELYRITPGWVERKQRLQEVISFLQAHVICAPTYVCHGIDQGATRGGNQDRFSGVARVVGIVTNAFHFCFLYLIGLITRFGVDSESVCLY